MTLKKYMDNKCDKATIIIIDPTNRGIEYQYCKEKQCDKASGSFGFGLYCHSSREYTNKAQLKMDIDNRDGLD